MGNLTCRVYLRNGSFTVIDVADKALVVGRTWYRDCHGGYVVSGGGRHTRRLHRLIVAAKPKEEVDHRDGNVLNNRRSNLRKATRTQNNANAKKREGCTSRFKGVTWNAARQNWRAQLGYLGKNHLLGDFSTEQSAARAYDVAARKYFKQFAKTNKSLGLL